MCERSAFGFPALRQRLSARIVRFCGVPFPADGARRRRLPGLAAAPESATLRERSVFGIEKPGFLREGSVSGGLIDQVSLISLWTPCSTGAPRSPVLAREVGIRCGSRGPPPLLAPTAAPWRFPRTPTTATLDAPFGSSAAVPRNGAGMVYFPARRWCELLVGSSPPLFLCSHSSFWRGTIHDRVRIYNLSHISEFFCNRGKKAPLYLCPMNLAIRRSEAAEGRNRSSAVRTFASRPTA